MQVCFCSFENEVHALFLENEWAEELIDGHTNHQGHSILSRVNIDGILAEELRVYLSSVKRADTEPARILRGILDLGFEAAELEDQNGPILNDLLHLIDQDVEAEIYLNTLLALYEIARQEGIAYYTKGGKKKRRRSLKKKPRKRASKKRKKKGRKKATIKGA